MTLYSDFLSNGVAYHHAGMDVEDRRLVEDAFRSGCISVLGNVFIISLNFLSFKKPVLLLWQWELIYQLTWLL